MNVKFSPIEHASARLPVPLHPYGCRLQDIPDDHRSPDGWHPRDCINFNRPDGSDQAPPPGWYSIPHWVALTSHNSFGFFYVAMPEIVSEWVGLPGGVSAGGSEKYDGSDQAKALAIMQAEGMAPIEWPAPPRMREELGIQTVLLFPDPILRTVFA